MSSLQTAVKRSASTGTNKKKRIQSFFIRIGSPPERKRASSEGTRRPASSRGDSEEVDYAASDGLAGRETIASTGRSKFVTHGLWAESAMEACIAEEPETPKLHQFSSRSVAEQLCLLDGEILRRIEPEELHNGAWMKREKEQLAPNVLAMVRTSNELAMMIPSEILEEMTTHGRAKVICSYIKIASRLHHLRNYNSLKAVLAGLQCTPIFRLKKTWKEVPNKRRKKFEKLTELMSEEYNWKLYRAELDECFAENTPCIPFLGVLLTTIVQQETASSGPSRQLTRNGGRKRISGVEMYTILEAITVRNRLEKLRKQSTNWRLSGIPEADNQRQAFKRSQSHFAKTSANTISDSNIRPLTEMITEDVSTRSILVGESSGSEDEDKCDSLIEKLRISEQRRGFADSTERRASADIIDSVTSADCAVLGTSSSDSETTPNSSPILLPRSSRLEDGDKLLSLKKKKKLKRLAADQPITEPFSSTTSDSSLPLQSSMKTSLSESLALDEIMKRSEMPELFDDLSHSGDSSSCCTDSHSSSPAPLPNTGATDMLRHDRSGAKVNLSQVTIQVTPRTRSREKPLNRLTDGGVPDELSFLSPGGVMHRCGSDDRMRKVTVLEPPPIEALYDAHYKEYAEVSRSLESLKNACDDLGGGPIPSESADFFLKEVDGELTSYVRKSISLQSLSSLDDSVESHSGSFSSHSDTSSQPSSSKTGPAHLSNDIVTNDNAFADDAITKDDVVASNSPNRHRLRSSSIDEVFAELDDPKTGHMIPRRRRLSSDCTNINTGNLTPRMSVTQNHQPSDSPGKPEVCRKSSYGPVRRRSRRKASLVLRLAQLGTESKNFSSDDHLFKYKFVSLRFSSDYQILPDLRTLLTNRPRNTEGQNYKLSYERE